MPGKPARGAGRTIVLPGDDRSVKGRLRSPPLTPLRWAVLAGLVVIAGNVAGWLLCRSAAQGDAQLEQAYDATVAYERPARADLGSGSGASGRVGPCPDGSPRR